MPGIWPSRRVAMLCIVALAAGAWPAKASVTDTPLASTARSRTRPSATMSFWESGSRIPRSASRTCCSVGIPWTISPASGDHLVGPEQQRRRQRHAERPGRVEIEDEPELRGLLDGQVRRLRALQDAIDLGGRAPEDLLDVRAVGHQPAGFREHMVFVHGRQPMVSG